jgi:Domain of unknown function (DUF4148)
MTVREIIMKPLIYAAVAAFVLAVPIISLAQQTQQTNPPLTRAQVQNELAELEQAGYDPRDWFHYPENIQAAEQRVAAKHAAQGR